MFVITVSDTLDHDVQIISIHNTKIQAIEALHNAVQISETQDEDILIVTENRIEVIERHPGWFSSGKKLTYVYKIIEHPGPTE